MCSEYEYLAPLERKGSLWRFRFYKHFVPTGLKDEQPQRSLVASCTSLPPRPGHERLLRINNQQRRTLNTCLLLHHLLSIIRFLYSTFMQ